MTAENEKECPYGSDSCPKIVDLKVEAAREFKEIKNQLKLVMTGLFLVCMFLAGTFGMEFVKVMI